MRHRSAVTASVVTLALALGAAACGSSSTNRAATSTPSATAGSSTTPATSATTAPAGPVTGPVPAVTGGTDLTKEPMVAAGGGAPPAQLTAQDLVTGTGPAAGASSTVQVQYVGALYTNGQVFDASWTNGSGPATFPLSGVIPGFKGAIVGMKVGGRREVVIPPALGYGTAGHPPAIPGNATLVFVIDLLKVS